MRFSFATVAAAALAACPSLTLALAPGHPYTIGRRHNLATPVVARDATGSANRNFQLNVINRFSDTPLYVYITGLDVDGRPGFIQPTTLMDADATWYYPQAGGHTDVPIPISEDLSTMIDMAPHNGSNYRSMNLPNSIKSGRVYLSEAKLQFSTVADKSDPSKSLLVEPTVVNPSDPAANLSWGFVELTYRGPDDQASGKSGVYANLSFVDWVGMVLGMSMRSATNEVQTVPGLDSTDALDRICDELEALQGKDAWWADLCKRKPGQPGQKGEVLHILSPNIFLHSAPQDALASVSTYYDEYVNQVWDKYRSQPLTVYTQLDVLQAGGVQVGDDKSAQCTCTTASGAAMSCTCPDGKTYSFAKPATCDIFGCNSGPFSADGDADVGHRQLRARLCAAFVRSTLLEVNGDHTPSSLIGYQNYYPVEAVATDHFSRIVHEHLEDKKGYTFSFDDVNPGGENSAGVIEMSEPTAMNIVAGGWVPGDDAELPYKV